MNNLLRQSEAAECGLVCLVIASSILGAEIDLIELRRKYQISSRGLTLREIKEIAASLNMFGRAVSCELNEVRNLKVPSILHWNLNHFVVLKWVRWNKVCIFDPAIGKKILRFDEFSKHFTGIALEISVMPNFQRKKEKSQLSILSWVNLSTAIYSDFFQILLFSLFLQCYVIIFPLFLQLAIDQSALKGDSDLLLALVTGFVAFSLFKVSADFLRGIVVTKLSATLNWEMTLRLFNHLLRLPLIWFQKRKLADVLSRFEAVNSIKDLLSGTLVSTWIDGFLAIVTYGMMFFFSPLLTIIVSIGFLSYVLVRFSTLSTGLSLGMELLISKIAENGKRIENIRAIQTIKAMGAELSSESVWANKFAKTVQLEQRQAVFNLTVKSAYDLIDSITYIAIIYFGVVSIIDKKISIGILYAFISYQSQFLGRIKDLFEKIIQWKLADIYSYRLSDIVLTPKEHGIDQTSPIQLEINGEIQISNLHFGYSTLEQPILKGITLRIKKGEFIAIIGSSGAGKSTLLKLICGLYQPTYGEVKIDGHLISSLGCTLVRKSIGMVLQDDELISGTIAENIAFFEEEIDIKFIWQCLEDVGLLSEVSKMPMKLETFIGDMGSSLSGGQKQRLFLARALYRRPKILLLDEATSHLDLTKEEFINNSLKRLSITRIVVAHRKETIEAASRVVTLENGKILLDTEN